MAIELKIPEVGESITDVEIGGWLKRQGDSLEKDEPLVTLESEKATVELPSPIAGRIGQILREKGQLAKVGEVIAYLEADGKSSSSSKQPGKSDQDQKEPQPDQQTTKSKQATASLQRIMPAAQRLMEEHGLDPSEITPTGPGGRILKEDVLRGTGKHPGRPVSQAGAPPTSEPAKEPKGTEGSQIIKPRRAADTAEREEEVIPMSRLRQTVAERLVHAKPTAALLSTLDRIEMSA